MIHRDELPKNQAPGFGPVNCFQIGHDQLAVFPGDKGQRVADQVNDAGLHRGQRKHRGDRVRKAPRFREGRLLTERARGSSAHGLDPWGGDLLKILWWDGQGLCLFAKRLEKGRFVWPSPADGIVALSPAQLGMLLEGIDWRMPRRTWRPELAG